VFFALDCLLSRFSDVFYVDASTRQTIRADLSQIALAKGIGESETATLDWLSRQRKEWLLLLDNADDPTSILVLIFPDALMVIYDYEPKPRYMLQRFPILPSFRHETRGSERSTAQDRAPR